jgi:hypothetical protein
MANSHCSELLTKMAAFSLPLAILLLACSVSAQQLVQVDFFQESGCPDCQVLAHSSSPTTNHHSNFNTACHEIQHCRASSPQT